MAPSLLVLYRGACSCGLPSFQRLLMHNPPFCGQVFGSLVVVTLYEWLCWNLCHCTSALHAPCVSHRSEYVTVLLVSGHLVWFPWSSHHRRPESVSPPSLVIIVSFFCVCGNKPNALLCALRGWVSQCQQERACGASTAQLIVTHAYAIALDYLPKTLWRSQSSLSTMLFSTITSAKPLWLIDGMLL